MQCLMVAGSLQGQADAHNKIRSVILYCLQWQNWSDTRWMKFNKSAQLYLRSKAVGIDYLVDMVMRAEGSTNDKHYIHGYTRYAIDEANLLFVVASVVVLGAFCGSSLKPESFGLDCQVCCVGQFVRSLSRPNICRADW